jgi:hypothetical protein
MEARTYKRYLNKNIPLLSRAAVGSADERKTETRLARLLAFSSLKGSYRNFGGPLAAFLSAALLILSVASRAA